MTPDLKSQFQFQLKRIFRSLFFKNTVDQQRQLNIVASASPQSNDNPDPLLLKAKTLNEEFYSEISQIDPSVWKKAENDILQSCKRREFRPDYTEDWINNYHRIFLTVRWLGKCFSQEDKNLSVLELGGITPLTDLCNEAYPQLKWQNSSGDLRDRWNIEDHSKDIVLCTELLEHVSDLPEGFSDSFLKTGLKAVLRESYRVLKPGGALLITTPNAGSVIHLEKALAGASPWIYPLHIHEYIRSEIEAEVKEAGFDIEQSQVIHCLTVRYYRDYTNLFYLLLKHGYPTHDRGDEIFMIVRKP